MNKHRSDGQQDLSHHLMHPLEDSEAAVERWVFGHRSWLLLFFLVVSLVLGAQALKLRPEASFEKMIPSFHPYIQNFLQHRSDLKGLGNAVRISVEATEGDIFSREFQHTLKAVHEEVFYINGVDRAALTSIWAAAVRWSEVTEEGFAGGPVVPDDYDGSDSSLEQLRANVLKSGQVGTLVANNFRSAIIHVPLYERDPASGQPLDYQRFSEDLERLIRDKYQSDSIRIHITGFAKVVGDLIEGLVEVVFFFAAALVITAIMLYGYCRCTRATFVAIFCSTMAVVWQLGLLRSLGYGLDPYSMLIPFLVFAIGVSHGVQIINAIVQESAGGADKALSARRAFRALYIPGLIALVSDGAGFATLWVIQIAVIQDLAVAASIGVAVIILTNLVLLPVLVSYLGVSPGAITHRKRGELRGKHPVWRAMSRLTGPRLAPLMILLGVVATAGGLYLSQDLRVGDLDPGAPELRPDSRYNQDNAFITTNYATSTDLLVVMVKSEPQQCSSYRVLDAMDQLQWRLVNLDGVQSTRSLADFSKLYMSAMNEGSIKWLALNRNQQLMDAASIKAPTGSYNSSCSLAPLLVFLNDHKAETLTEVVSAVEAFAQENNQQNLQFLLGAGNAGVEAATNIVIEQAQYQMLAWVYGVVSLLVLLTFRSLRTLICIMVPLMLTSVLCQALMSFLGIGIKVATLPVIALGVGIGVDYGIYIYSRLEAYLGSGMPLREAYFSTLKTTGKAVAFTGVTLAVGVGTWFFSSIKFQADMGLLLTFMFLWNMVGALVLLPALARFLIKTEPQPKRVSVPGAVKQHSSIPRSTERLEAVEQV